MSEDTWPVKVENGLATDEKPEFTNTSESSSIPPPINDSTLESTTPVKMENGHEADTKDLFSGSTPPPALPASSSRSRSPSPDYTPISNGNGKKAKKASSPVSGPILIDDLPIAWDQAHETFETLDKCVYERKDLGTSKESEDMMVCDCSYDKHDSSAESCADNSTCINRALFIECLASECRAKNQCRNQRFVKKQYAPVDIVLTEMKGYGLRASRDIPSGSLIYEYIGEVVAEKTFRKRMASYAQEGIRHFYFMMLQKEEYIDATKKGGIGRFANHSCNPNSEVQKWVVGRRLRMGIFTKRDVVKGEEITFNYNVDRYGHDAQICYCGEPNCVGFIGGKTQTDSTLGTMNDLFIDALGIADEVEALQLKGTKKKKSKQLDEDFTPTLRPIQDAEVQKVAAAIRQSGENKKMMSKLLQRVQMTDDAVVHRQLMRLHGFGLMNTVLTQLGDDREVVLLALESMKKWKVQVRNKVEDSGIEVPVQMLADGDDEELKSLAQELLDFWSGLETSYKIPRKSKIESLDADDAAATTTIEEADSFPRINPRRPQAWENDIHLEMNIAPIRPRPLFHRPRPPPPPPLPRQPSIQNAMTTEKMKLDAIIAMAQQNVMAAAAVAAVESPAAESSRSGSRTLDDDEGDRRKRQRREVRPEEEERRKERRLKMLVGDVVVRSMSKYKQQMEHETFKRYARECTELLVEKEKRGSSYASHRHPSLSEEKQAKMKSFTKEYAHKVLKKLKEKGKLRKTGVSGSRSSLSAGNGTPAMTSSSDTPRTVLQTPNDHDGEGGDDLHGILVNDIFGGDEDALDGDDGMDMEMDVDGQTPSEKPSQTPTTPTPISTPQAKATPVSSAIKLNGGSFDGYGAIKVDSFRPGMTDLTKATPSRTSTSSGDPSPKP